MNRKFIKLIFIFLLPHNYNNFAKKFHIGDTFRDFQNHMHDFKYGKAFEYEICSTDE